MNRNTEMHFSQIPTLEISRSKFDMSHTHLTTANAGRLYPCYVDCDIVPGDTVTMRQSEIVRMMTPIAPVMDNCFMDFYWFFIPDRLVYSAFKQLMGENDTAPWTIQHQYEIPQLYIKNTSGSPQYKQILKDSVLNHMGIPITNWNNTSTDGEKQISISALPARAYALVWNEFFRDENLQNPMYIPTDAANYDIYNSTWTTYTSDPEAAQTAHGYRGGFPCMPVCKVHDYFTSCLPGAQKGPTTTIPLVADGQAPIKFASLNTEAENPEWDMDNGPLAINTTWSSGSQNKQILGTFLDEDGDPLWLPEPPVSGDFKTTEVKDYMQPYTDLSNAIGTTVTALRQAFSIQKFYERDARGGTRYIESVWSHFRVRNPDYRLQRPEYLGGFRQNINMNQVIQNSPTVEDSTPLGTTGAYSVTTHEDNDVFSHSFTEHGILLGLFCIRQEHTYCQGINRMWSKKKRLDFYSPEFANLSEQAVLNKEIYAQGTADDEKAFGYQEAWAEMRYKPNVCTGEMSLVLDDSLGATWTYADKYTEKPTLGNKWIQETDANISRTLAIQNHDQFMLDFYFAPIYTRPLPLYSVPGLIDHH